MPKTTVCKQFSFDAAHRLLNHDGKCANEHGHTYKLEVFVRGVVNDITKHPKQGMVVDFYDISTVWKESLEPYLDHQNLNESIGPMIGITTAENMATWILDKFSTALNARLIAEAAEQDEPVSIFVPELFKVRLWETPTGYAEVES